MAADEARADRIRQLKGEHPELTWRAIADHVGVSERAAIDWQKTGGIDYEHAKKLAELFPEVDLDYVWRGPTPDPFATLSDVPDDLQTQLNEIKAAQERTEKKVSELADLIADWLATTEEPEAPPTTRRASA